MNELIEQLFSNFSVPVFFMFYDGSADTYITYRHVDYDTVLSADNKIINYVDYYDFDIFSRTNYSQTVESMKTTLTNGGFMWQPTRSSADMYETDTKYYHKTLCFAKERSN